MLTIDNDIHVNEVDINIEMVTSKRCWSKGIILWVTDDGFIFLCKIIMKVCAVDK